MDGMMHITGNTRIFGILADPIHHVKTPERLNLFLAQHKIDGVMFPMHVHAGGLSGFVRGLRHMANLGGVVVTVPHKKAMSVLCDELTAPAMLAGGVNVVRREPNGRLLGHMLDGDGFVAGLRAEGFDPSGLSAYLAGAGGAASAIAFALAQAGVRRLTIANRTVSTAAELVQRIAQEFPRIVARVGTRDPSGHDLVMNGTSLGMCEADPLPLDADRLSGREFVAEIIMEPSETALLRMARKKGCHVMGGIPMLEHQIVLMARFMGGLGAGL